jgi:hypothetical protein
MKRLVLAVTLALVCAALPLTAFAGSPHFVFVDVSQSGNTLTVTGKEAGLGNETQVEIRVTADAQCVNPGGNKPSAANKQSVTASGVFPVQNGRADFTLSATATFQPNCTPPMTVVFSNVVVTDVTHGVTETF